MSCGSTISNKSTGSLVFPPTFSGLGWFWKIAFSWLDGIVQGMERRRQYRQLLELDDRMLADIGLEKTTAGEVRRCDLYLIAWRDSR